MLRKCNFVVYDLSNIDESFCDFTQYFIDRTVTLEDVRGVVKELFLGGETDQMFYMFAVFRKA